MHVHNQQARFSDWKEKYTTAVAEKTKKKCIVYYKTRNAKRRCPCRGACVWRVHTVAAAAFTVVKAASDVDVVVGGGGSPVR